MRDFQSITTERDLDVLVKELLNGPDLVGLDVETGYVSAEAAPGRAIETRHPDFIVVGLSVTNNSSWARYVPLRHDNEKPLDPKRVWETFRPVLEQKSIVAHNASFERAALNSLIRAGDVEKPLQMKNLGHDTMLMAHALNTYRQVGLKYLTGEVLGEEQVEFGALFGDSVKDKNGKISAAKLKRARFNYLGITPEVISYACDDAALCLELYNQFSPGLSEAQRRSYMVEMQIMVLMSQAEEYGMGVDWAGIEKAYAEYQTFRPHYEKLVREEFAAMTVDPELKKLAREANFGSAVQMRKLLYDGLGMKTTRKTDTGADSTDAQALEGLSRKHPAVRSLLNLREIDVAGRRLKKWLAEYSMSYDKRVHPSFSQTRVVTGRFAASNPAVQQLPKQWVYSTYSPNIDENEQPILKGEPGEDYWTGNFREFIIAGEGKKLITFDYQAQEIRMLAGITQEPVLLNAIARREDPHKAAAALIFGVPLEHVTKDQRAKGKTIQFSLLYGMGPKAMAERLAVSIEEAEQMVNAYLSRLSRVGNWRTHSQTSGIENQYVTTWVGRRIPLWDARSDKPGLVAGAERLAVNAQIQGGSADYTKLAMLRAWNMLKAKGLWGPDKVMLTMNQHDSLTFEFDESLDPNEIRAILQEAVVFDARKMFPKMQIPEFPVFDVDWEMGKTWGSSVGWSLSEKAVSTDTGWEVEGKQEKVPEIKPWVPSQKAFEPPKVTALQFAEPQKALHVVAREDIKTAQVGRFRQILEEYPGDTSVYLTIGPKTTRLRRKTGLSSAEKNLISLALDGAEVYDRTVEDMKVIMG